MLIAQTDNFIIESHESPEVSRTDGGHLVVSPKVKVEDRTKLNIDLTIELALLTSLVGKAMKDAMNELGVEIGRINYQDNGNWKPELHIHLYGRAVNATYQTFGEPLKVPRKLEDKIAQEPLTERDCEVIRDKIIALAHDPEYQQLKLS